MLVVAWADGKLSEGEGDTIRDHARTCPKEVRDWIEAHLRVPPGPYFRYQVAHLLSFLACTWARNENHAEAECLATGQEWAEEVVANLPWTRRFFGGTDAERRDLDAMRRALRDHTIPATDRIWAMARGAHADADPTRAVVVHTEHDQDNQVLAVVLDTGEERVAVGCFLALTRDEDLDSRRVADLLARSRELREPERWALLAQEVYRAGRPLTPHQKNLLREELVGRIGGDFEECDYTELAYLEDALAVDARWMSWVAGRSEEFAVHRDEVLRKQAPGTFSAEREDVEASVAQKLVAGPPGLAFRILTVKAGDDEVRLASPVVTQDPATPEAVQWIARFLPSMCDPYTQLILDEDGPRWIAEVWGELTDGEAKVREPLLPGRSLLVPPWVWFRAADALGVRFFAARRRYVA